MRAVLNVLVIVSFLALCIAPAANMIRPLLEQTPLEGVLPEQARPELGIRPLFEETFQKGFTAWFDQHYGARPTLTRLDNSILYYVFHEARGDKYVRVGQDGVLYFSHHLDHYNSRNRYDFARYAKRVRAAQLALRAHGVELAFILIPTKTTIWPDKLPPRWLDVSPEDRPSAKNIERDFRQELDRSGAEYVDGVKVLADLTARDREAVYTIPGRHLAAPAACMLTAAALDIARPHVRGKIVPPLDCSYEMRGDVGLHEEEYDIWRLLNIWAPRPAARAPFVRFDLPERVPAAERVEVLVVGTSFGWKIVKEGDRNHAFANLQFHYYNTTLADWPAATSKHLELGSDEWKRLVLSKQIVIYAVPEEYFGDADNPFWRAVLKAFAEPTPEIKALLE